MDAMLETIIRDAIKYGRTSRQGKASMVAGFALAGAKNHEGNGRKVIDLAKAVANLPSNDYTRGACIAMSSFLDDYQGIGVTQNTISRTSEYLIERASNC